MSTKYKFLIFIPILFGLFLLFLLFIGESNVEVLNPKGWVGLRESHLLIFATLVMLLVVIPVFMLAFLFPWKYRSNNKKAAYAPEEDSHLFAEIIWWGLPFVIVLVLSVLTWLSSNELDPYRPLQSDKKPMTVQVVALQWKWLFIYPEQEVASVNFMPIPTGVPIHFEITSDAPMNSFWIPELGGQIYAMPGMKTDLHLIADTPGYYSGSSANLSGKGFASMTFIVEASSSEDFDKWVKTAKQSKMTLNREEYNQLAKPSIDTEQPVYALSGGNLFHDILMKYMMPMPEQN